MSFKKFTWAFSIGDHHTELSCIATSVSEARVLILEQIAKITVMHSEFEALMLVVKNIACSSDARKNARERIKAMNATLEIDAFIGCWTSEVLYFTEDAEIRDYLNDHTKKTLKTLITTSEPVISPFYRVSLRSCLDG